MDADSLASLCFLPSYTFSQGDEPVRASEGSFQNIPSCNAQSSTLPSSYPIATLITSLPSLLEVRQLCIDMISPVRDELAPGVLIVGT
jgi:hypothetical protein